MARLFALPQVSRPRQVGRDRGQEEGRLEKQLEAHEKANPTPIIARLDGTPLTDAKGKPLENAPKIEQLILDEIPAEAVSTHERPVPKDHAKSA